MPFRLPGLHHLVALLVGVCVLCAFASPVLAAKAQDQDEVYGVPRHVTTTT